MIWRVGDQKILAEDGQSFVLIEPNGTISARFEPSVGSDDDERLRFDFIVEGDRLLERMSRDRFGVITETRDSVELTGLRPAAESATRALVDLALAEDRARADEEGARRQREREARITEIDGALDDFSLGEHFARAQAALVKAVRTSPLSPQPGLLRTLVNVGRARPPAPVLNGFTRSCLIACFKDDLPEALTGDRAKLPALAAELRARERELRVAAELAVDIDANLAADKYKRAADEMEAAARLAD